MDRLQYIVKDLGVEILPVHRLKLSWLMHRRTTLANKYKAFIQNLDREWFEWEAKTEAPSILDRLDRVYEIAKGIKKEWGV